MSIAQVICCVLLLTGPDHDDLTAASLEEVKGRWLQGALIFRPSPEAEQMIYGHNLPIDDPVKLLDNRALLVIDGGEFLFRNKKHQQRGRVKVNPTETPKTIDFLYDDKTLLGVYDIEDGWLRLSIGDERTRPKQVEPKDAKGVLTIRLKKLE